MGNNLFVVLRMLEKNKIHFYIERNRPDSVLVAATLVGKRVEIDVFDDDHIEVSCFLGRENVEGGMDLLMSIIKEG